MHEGCVPYKTMHPDAECLRKNAVTVIKIKFRLQIISFWFVLLQAIIRRTINLVLISSIGLLQTSSYFRDA